MGRSIGVVWYRRAAGGLVLNIVDWLTYGVWLKADMGAR